MIIAKEDTYKVVFAGICGSDLQKTNPATTSTELRQLGHEIVVKTTNGHAVVNPMKSCKKCEACTTLGEMFCNSLEAIGRTSPGAFSGSIVAPSSNIIPIHFSQPRLGVLADPLAVVLHGMHKLQHSQHILILGDGSIAQLTMLYFALSDNSFATCTLVAKSLHRATHMQRQYELILKSLKKRVNITHVVPPELTYDSVIECVGRDQSGTLHRAINAVATKGRIVSFGVYPVGYKVDIDIRTLLYKEASIIGSNSYNHVDLIRATTLIGAHEDVFSVLLGKSFSHPHEAFAAARKSVSQPKKSVISFEEAV